MEKSMASKSADIFFKEYTSQDTIAKYTRATVGFGIRYLLNHDYKAVYAEALALQPPEIRQGGCAFLNLGVEGMNLLHLVSALNGNLIRVEKAIGTDFSPVLIEAAKRKAELQ